MESIDSMESMSSCSTRNIKSWWFEFFINETGKWVLTWKTKVWCKYHHKSMFLQKTLNHPTVPTGIFVRSLPKLTRTNNRFLRKPISQGNKKLSEKSGFGSPWQLRTRNSVNPIRNRQRKPVDYPLASPHLILNWFLFLLIFWDFLDFRG